MSILKKDHTHTHIYKERDSKINFESINSPKPTYKNPSTVCNFIDADGFSILNLNPQ